MTTSSARRLSRRRFFLQDTPAPSPLVASFDLPNDLYCKPDEAVEGVAPRVFSR